MNEFKKLLRIAFKNLKCHRWLNIKIIGALTCFVFLICMFCIFPVSLALTQIDYMTKYVTANKIETYDNLDGRLTQEHIKYCIKECPTDYSYYQQLTIQVGKSSYTCDKLTLTLLKIYSGDVFTQNDYKAFKASYGYDSIIIGDMAVLDNEILISEEMLGSYGLTADDVLKKEVTFIDSLSGQPFGGEVIVSGIIRKEFYKLYGHDSEINIKPSVYVADIGSLGITEYNSLNVYAFKEYPSKETIEGWVNKGLIKDSTKYFGWNILSGMEFIKHLQQVTIELFAVLGVLVLAGILFTLYLLMNKYIKYFSKSAGIMSVCGMTNAQLNAMMYIQLFIFCLIAAVISLALAVGIYSILGQFLNFYMSGNVMGVDFRFLLILFGIGIASVFAVSSLIFAFNYLATRKATVKQLLETRLQ